MNELKNRGMDDILLAVVDGLKGFPDAITAVFPEAVVQTCLFHLLRNSMDFVSWKDRRGLAGALKEIYRAVDADAAATALTAFEAGPLGPALPGDRPELAARLGRSHSVLRLPRRRAPDHPYDERHRSAELEAPAGHSGKGPLSKRRCGDQAALSDLEPIGERVENAAP